MAGRARMDFGRAASGPVEFPPVYLPWWGFFAHVNCRWRTMGTRRASDGTREPIVKGGTVDLDLAEPLPARLRD